MEASYGRNRLRNLHNRNYLSPILKPGCTYHGRFHGDTRMFDTTELVRQRWPDANPLSCQLISIKIWHGAYLKHTPSVNGLQFTFFNHENHETYTSPEYFGDHDLGGAKEYHLETGEYISNGMVAFEVVIYGLALSTTHKRTIKTGADSAENNQYMERKSDKDVVVGFAGGYGGHLHNLGFCFASINDLTFARRKQYLLLRKRLMEKREDTLKERNKIHRALSMLSKNDKESSIGTLAFVDLVLFDMGYIFGEVISYF